MLKNVEFTNVSVIPNGSVEPCLTHIILKCSSQLACTHSQATNGPPAIRHFNGVSLADR